MPDRVPPPPGPGPPRGGRVQRYCGRLLIRLVLAFWGLGSRPSKSPLPSGLLPALLVGLGLAIAFGLAVGNLGMGIPLGLIFGVLLIGPGAEPDPPGPE